MYFHVAVVPIISRSFGGSFQYNRISLHHTVVVSINNLHSIPVRYISVSQFMHMYVEAVEVISLVRYIKSHQLTCFCSWVLNNSSLQIQCLGQWIFPAVQGEELSIPC